MEPDVIVTGISTAGAAGIVTLIINGFTAAFPMRPSWSPFVLAVVLGFVFQAMIIYRLDNVFSANLWIDAVLLGIPAGLGAIGINASTRTAEEKRAVAQFGSAAQLDGRAVDPAVNG